MKMTLLTNERGHDARARRPAVQPALQFYKQLELCDTQSASFGLHFGREANWRIGRSNLANWTTTPRRLGPGAWPPPTTVCVAAADFCY